MKTRAELCGRQRAIERIPFPESSATKSNIFQVERLKVGCLRTKSYASRRGRTPTCILGLAAGWLNMTADSFTPCKVPLIAQSLPAGFRLCFGTVTMSYGLLPTLDCTVTMGLPGH